MESGIEYKVTEEGLEIFLRGTHYRELGLKIKEGSNAKFFLKTMKRFISELNNKLLNN